MDQHQTHKIWLRNEYNFNGAFLRPGRTILLLGCSNGVTQTSLGILLRKDLKKASLENAWGSVWKIARLLVVIAAVEPAAPLIAAQHGSLGRHSDADRWQRLPIECMLRKQATQVTGQLLFLTHRLLRTASGQGEKVACLQPKVLGSSSWGHAPPVRYCWCSRRAVLLPRIVPLDGGRRQASLYLFVW